MGTLKKKIGFSDEAQKEASLNESAFNKVAQNLVAETKAKNSYLVISDKNGKIKKIPAKDL